MRFTRWLLWSTLLISCASTAREPALNTDYEAVFAGLAMGCIHKEYSNKIAHYMNEEGDPYRDLDMDNVELGNRPQERDDQVAVDEHVAEGPPEGDARGPADHLAANGASSAPPLLH